MYKVISIILIFFCFGIFSCLPVNARDIEGYRQLEQEYAPIIEKADAARELDDFFNNRISINLLKSSNPFLRMILMWQCISFMRDATILELQGEAPWMTNK